MSVNAIPDDLRDALTAAVRVARLLVASDFDGCIAPIVSRPHDATPNAASITALRAAADLTDTTAAVISGRALADLRLRTGLDDARVRLVGSHGSEFDEGFSHNQFGHNGANKAGFQQEITAAHTSLLTRVTAEFESIAHNHPGVSVETKPVSAALHVRNAAPDVAAAALSLARTGAATWSGVQVTEGKAVIELSVIETSKGYALDLLRQEFAADAAIYLGDDVTDEKAFDHLRGEHDVSIKVGDGHTAARYRIDSPDEVASVLWLVADSRRKWLLHTQS
ncbi:MAG: trehalose-phosphatase [Gordonia sp. (in: high G+C Gram-positive bacteria)]